MMKIIIFLSMILGVFVSQAVAMDSLSEVDGGQNPRRTMTILSKDDITKSTKRILNAFTLTKDQNAILEQGTAVGRWLIDGNKACVTYRPSLGLEFLSCIDKDGQPLDFIHPRVDGKGHRGLTSRFSAEEVNSTIIVPFMTHIKLRKDDFMFVIEGASAGAHRAVETALYLKQHPDTRDFPMVVLRYGDATTFDDLATRDIHRILGQDHIVSFHIEGDITTEYMNMPDVRSHLGTRINLRADNSTRYKNRVEQKSYTHMHPILKPFAPCLSKLSIFPFSFLRPDVWEKHQPLAYSELAPHAF